MGNILGRLQQSLSRRLGEEQESNQAGVAAPAEVGRSLPASVLGQEAAAAPGKPRDQTHPAFTSEDKPPAGCPRPCVRSCRHVDGLSDPGLDRRVSP